MFSAKVLLGALIVFSALTVKAFGREELIGTSYADPAGHLGVRTEFLGTNHVRADFDGDGYVDDVWVLVQRQYPWKVKIFFARTNGTATSDLVEEGRDRSVPAQNVRLSVLNAPIHWIDRYTIELEHCNSEKWSDSFRGCTLLKRTEKSSKLPGLHFCIVNGGCATYIWNVDAGRMTPINRVLSSVEPAPAEFVGRRYSTRTTEVLGIKWHNSGGIWSRADGSKYTISTAGPNRDGVDRVRYLWLDKLLTSDPLSYGEHEIRFAVLVDFHPKSARLDVDSCRSESGDKSLVAIVDVGANLKMRALQAWQLDLGGEQLVPIDVSTLDCRDRKW